MIKDWNVGHVIAECQKMHHAANDPYLTGWVNWPCKQDLYLVKFAIDDMLERTSAFVGEEEWLEEQQKEREQQKVWRALNEVQNVQK